MRIVIPSALIFLLVAALCLPSCKPTTEQVAASFDAQTHQQPIMRHSQLDSVLAQMPIVKFGDLDTAYLRFAGIEGKWKRELKKKTWHRVIGDQSQLFVVGKFRVRDFMAHSNTLENPHFELDEPDRQYFCMDKRVLHKLLDLLTWMHERDLDTDELLVNYGFRHPALNFRAGGVQHSRHQWGEAIDLVVGDVNRDGLRDDADKKLLIEVLDKKIIANGGGVGRYPGTPIIHMDVRGHRARWDQQGPSAAMKAQMASEKKLKHEK